MQGEYWESSSSLCKPCKAGFYCPYAGIVESSPAPDPCTGEHELCQFACSDGYTCPPGSVNPNPVDNFCPRGTFCGEIVLVSFGLSMLCMI